MRRNKLAVAEWYATPAYPQAPAKMPLYMRLPQGYRRNGMTRKTHALKLIHNVYGQKQAGLEQIHGPGHAQNQIHTK